MTREKHSMSTGSRGLFPLAVLAVLVWCTVRGLALAQPSAPSAEPQTPSASARHISIGREVVVPVHLQDGQEFATPLDRLFAHGKLLFNANWTEQEGGGCPLTKGTGRPVADPAQPLTGRRAFNRVSGPDANSCFGCHNAPYGLSGGCGERAALLPSRLVHDHASGGAGA